MRHVVGGWCGMGVWWLSWRCEVCMQCHMCTVLSHMMSTLCPAGECCETCYYVNCYTILAYIVCYSTHN
jgi:hypothetical protein